MAQLSAHVLDTSLGRPARGVRIQVYAIENAVRQLLHDVETNADGRLNSAFPVSCGVYEMEFWAGDYLRGIGVVLPDPPFVDHILIRFGIAEPEGRYHVPLLLSPYGYSTYRGS